MPADYVAPISYIVSISPLEFSSSANNCYDSSNFGTLANDLTIVLNEMFQRNMDADVARYRKLRKCTAEGGPWLR